MGVVNVVDRAAGDVFAADFGAAVASMRDSLAFVSVVMDANQVSDAGKTAMGAGASAVYLLSHARVFARLAPAARSLLPQDLPASRTSAAAACICRAAACTLMTSIAA